MADDRVALTKQVKEANDIVAVVGGYVALHPSGPTFKGLCPFHNDHRPSLDVDPRRQRFRCWSCGKFGDVFSFVQEFEKVDFLEARALLARRAGISLEGDPGRNAGRARLLEVMRWAAARYQEFFHESTVAEPARAYLAERGLTPDSIKTFGLGFAPVNGDWLVSLARQQKVSWETLREVGLIAERKEGKGFYDRFRDRVMFPIRDVRGQTVGFGGRILPNSPYASRGPKYYNSTETPLFNKSELLYGLDLARHAAADAGFLAVVEGYTDVMMAHQTGVGSVVATMGTALNARHVHQLRRFAPRVVLVYDADAGGAGGVDRALEIFVSNDVELAIATLPEGLDPCDLLVRQGPEAFRQALAEAVDVLDYKLNLLLARESGNGIEATRRVVDAILGLLALAPELTGQAGQVKRELIVTRLAHRLGLRHETVWARFGELQHARRQRETPRGPEAPAAPKAAPAPPLERQLLEILLAEPNLVPVAALEVRPDDLTHAGLRRLLENLYALQARGEPADLDGLRPLLNHPALAAKALEMQEIGRTMVDRPEWLRRIVAAFRERVTQSEQRRLRDQLTGVDDHAAAVELLRKLQNQTASSDS